MTSTTVAARVAALRQRRAELGLVRLELYVHPDDAPTLRQWARLLERSRKAEQIVGTLKKPRSA